MSTSAPTSTPFESSNSFVHETHGEVSSSRGKPPKPEVTITTTSSKSEHLTLTPRRHPVQVQLPPFKVEDAHCAPSPMTVTQIHPHQNRCTHQGRPSPQDQAPPSTGTQTSPGEDRLVEFIGDEFLNKNPHTRRTILWNPRRSSSHDPVVLYRFYQFVCPCTGKVWFSPLHRAKDGCFCRDCHRFVKPFGYIDGLTPYMGHELCYAKFECHVCNRSWSCQKSKSNFPDNCYNCGTIVYPYYQVAHSVLQRKIRKQAHRNLRYENSYCSEAPGSSDSEDDYEIHLGGRSYQSHQATGHTPRFLQLRNRNPGPEKVNQHQHQHQVDHQIRVVTKNNPNGGGASTSYSFSKMIIHSSEGSVPNNPKTAKLGAKKNPKVGTSLSAPALHPCVEKYNNVNVELIQREDEFSNEKQR